MCTTEGRGRITVSRSWVFHSVTGRVRRGRRDRGLHTVKDKCGARGKTINLLHFFLQNVERDGSEEAEEPGVGRIGDEEDES